MRQKLVLFALAVAGGMLGANVQPILSGAGKLLFPEASPSAYLQASSGALTIAAGGANQNVVLRPSGTGAAIVNGAVELGANITYPGAGLKGMWSQAAAGTVIQGSGSAYDVYVANKNGTNVIAIPTGTTNAYVTGNLGCGGNSSPSYAADCTGDINTSTVYRKGGTAGVGVGNAITVCTSGACATSCTLIFNGGIRTGGTCP